MALSEKDVRYVARLSRLEITDEEAGKYTQQLSSILSYIEQLNELETKDVEPLTHVLDLKNVFRPDVAQPSLTQAEVLSNAPDPQSGHFRVPKIM